MVKRNRSLIRRMQLSLTLLILLPFSVFADFAPAQLRVGFSRLDITPPVGGTMTGPAHSLVVGTEDPIEARAIVLQRGERMMAIVGVDLVKIRRDLANDAIALAASKINIDPDAVMICASHNHSSPLIPLAVTAKTNKEYLSKLPALIADSIERAYHAREPANMFLGRSLVYDGLHNRRVISKVDEMALNTWLHHLNDIEKTPQVLGTEGPIDPELWVARFDASDGHVLGTLVNFHLPPQYAKPQAAQNLVRGFPRSNRGAPRS